MIGRAPSRGKPTDDRHHDHNQNDHNYECGEGEPVHDHQLTLAHPNKLLINFRKTLTKG